MVAHYTQSTVVDGDEGCVCLIWSYLSKKGRQVWSPSWLFVEKDIERNTDITEATRKTKLCLKAFITSGMLRAEESTVYQELIMFEKNKTIGSTGQLGREEDELILLSPRVLHQ